MLSDAASVMQSARCAEMPVDEGLYSIDAILRTAYWFTDRAYLFLFRSAEHVLTVRITVKAPTLDRPQQESLEVLLGEFQNALLDNQLRESIEQRTGKLRELLVAKALLEAGTDEVPPGSPNDPVADNASNTLVQINT